ncbi:MAG: helix-turn-helix domain-containing protein [Pyrinomonadaceae bacterium]|nr:helix-turn-helix domain-containing protein [Pyrinomonadaceae bacterium]
MHQISQNIVELQSKDFLTINEVCELLSLSRRVVSHAINTKKLPSVRFGRRVVVRRKDLDSLFI